MRRLTFMDCFAGIGGFRMALEQLGFVCVASCEIDKHARKAYRAIYGGEEPFYDDIKDIDPRELPDFDLLTGGFPCQAFSVAGKRKGFEDTRGTLFFEIARIAKEKRPKALLLENVKGLVNHDKGRTLDIMIKTLNEIGYVVDFEVLNSKYFGVPQNRERIFIIAVRDDLIDSEPFNKESTKGNTIVPKRKRQINEWAKTFNFDWPEHTEVTARLRDILEDNVDEKYYLSEEKTAKLVAQLEEKDRIVGTVGHHPFSKKYEFKGYNSDISPSLIATDYKAPKTVLESEPQMLGHVDIKGHDAIKRVYSTEGVSPTLTTMGGGHRQPKIIERQTVIDDTQGFDGARIYNDETPTLLSERYGLKVVEEVHPALTPAIERVKSNLKNLVRTTRKEIDFDIKIFENGDMRAHRLDEKKSTLSEWVVNNEENQSDTVLCTHVPKIYGETTYYRIRKLTPLECWRLQGFPDWAFDRAKSAGISDTQLYKQAGNAVTVNVVYEIGKRLVKKKLNMV